MEIIFFKQFFGCLPLQCPKPQFLFFIPFNGKPDPVVAEITNTVEKYDGVDAGLIHFAKVATLLGGYLSGKSEKEL